MKWSINDLIDLEYFILGDDESDQQDLIRRDRAIYLALNDATRNSRSRPLLIRHWLQVRRRSETGEKPENYPLPGTVFRETRRLLTWGALLVGFCSGAGLALSLLRYQGVRPVNVSDYVATLIGIQIALLFLLLAAALLHRPLRLLRQRPAAASFWGALLFRLGKRGVEAAGARFPAEFRHRFLAAFGLLKNRHTVYGNLFLLPLFLIGQWFGLAFNLGALAATLAKVATTDLAFGWQTTLQAAPATVHQIIRGLALPWSWLFPEGMGFPTLLQIENSRIVLKDGMAHLATPDLVSWWPFLSLGLLCYGVFPRLAMAVFTLSWQHLLLARLDFSHTGCDRLVGRLLTPLLETGPASSGPSPEKPGAPLSLFPEKFSWTDSAPAVLLAEKAFLERAGREQLQSVTAARFGLEVVGIFPIGGPLQEEEATLAHLSERDWGGKRPALVLIQEAWQPPIIESLSLLRKLRPIATENGRIAILLVGRPAPPNFCTQPSETDLRVWKRQLQALGDPYLAIATPGKEV
ncbi:MAG: DUF2868 domain-containing protein [Deltaproteobacteria bacterium]|nr:DUF2868 domain-containing protein [Deltaproteobacteria bacterium]